MRATYPDLHYSIEDGSAAVRAVADSVAVLRQSRVTLQSRQA